MHYPTTSQLIVKVLFRLIILTIGCYGAYRLDEVAYTTISSQNGSSADTSNIFFMFSLAIGALSYVYTLRLIRPISYLGACYIRTKVTKCIREKMTMFFRGLTIKSHSSGYEIGPINRSV